MEACDKQFETYEGHDLPKDPLDVWEDAWRAALKHLQSYMKNYTCRGRDIVQVENYIKKELEDK